MLHNVFYDGTWLFNLLIYVKESTVEIRVRAKPTQQRLCANVPRAIQENSARPACVILILAVGKEFAGSAAEVKVNASKW